MEKGVNLTVLSHKVNSHVTIYPTFSLINVLLNKWKVLIIKPFNN